MFTGQMWLGISQFDPKIHMTNVPIYFLKLLHVWNLCVISELHFDLKLYYIVSFKECQVCGYFLLLSRVTSCLRWSNSFVLWHIHSMAVSFLFHCGKVEIMFTEISWLSGREEKETTFYQCFWGLLGVSDNLKTSNNL